MKAIVNTIVAGLYKEPDLQSVLLDEALYGMAVDILSEPYPGWYQVRTPYRYEGLVSAGALLMDERLVREWEALPKKIVRNKNFCDVLAEPKVQSRRIAHLARGCAVSPAGEAAEGWQSVRLADGQTGYVMDGILAPDPAALPSAVDEAALRRALVDAAMLYQGTHYRWGGKSPMGIDCSGMVSMAYMLCGIFIHRDANIEPGFPIHEIPVEALKEGDLLFFPGHVAMYLGDGRYCHSTARAGADGFTINSLNPDHPEYLEDLKNRLTQAGSYFAKG